MRDGLILEMLQKSSRWLHADNGQIKRCNKSGGEWISSIDLENAAVGHPDVEEACVVGVPHPKWDEDRFFW